MRDGFRGIVEAIERAFYATKTGDGGAFSGSFEEYLESNADCHKGFAGLDVFSDCGEVACFVELGHAVAEMANAWEDEFLQKMNVISLGS